MRFLISVLAISSLFVSDITSQSFVFGVDGGLSMGLQSWNGFQRDPLFTYHFDGYIESWNEENKFTLLFTMEIIGIILNPLRLLQL